MFNKREKLKDIVEENFKLFKIASGFQFTEGPVWNDAQNFLLFSDIPANRIYRWSEDEGIKIFREPSGNSNGLTYDENLNLIICEHGNRRISKIDRNGNYTILAERFKGKRFNSPNDVVVKSGGTIYFTDPPYGIKPEQQELPFRGVYSLDIVKNKLTLRVKNFERPNGLAFSPKEKFLYIADTPKRQIWIFDVMKDGTLNNGRIFVETISNIEGGPDGMKVDIKGNLYVASAGGIWIFSNIGEILGIIETPERPSNLAWGGKKFKNLYITARTSLYCLELKISGSIL